MALSAGLRNPGGLHFRFDETISTGPHVKPLSPSSPSSVSQSPTTSPPKKPKTTQKTNPTQEIVNVSFGDITIPQRTSDGYFELVSFLKTSANKNKTWANYKILKAFNTAQESVKRALNGVEPVISDRVPYQVWVHHSLLAHAAIWIDSDQRGVIHEFCMRDISLDIKALVSSFASQSFGFKQNKPRNSVKALESSIVASSSSSSSSSVSSSSAVSSKQPDQAQKASAPEIKLPDIPYVLFPDPTPKQPEHKMPSLDDILEMEKKMNDRFKAMDPLLRTFVSEQMALSFLEARNELNKQAAFIECQKAVFFEKHEKETLHRRKQMLAIDIKWDQLKSQSKKRAAESPAEGDTETNKKPKSAAATVDVATTVVSEEPKVVEKIVLVLDNK